MSGFFRVCIRHSIFYVCVTCCDLDVTISLGETEREKDIVQELCESRGGRPGLSVLTSLLVSVDVKLYRTGHSFSLRCQLTSEDINHHFIISERRREGRTTTSRMYHPKEKKK